MIDPMSGFASDWVPVKMRFEQSGWLIARTWMPLMTAVMGAYFSKKPATAGRDAAV